MILSSRELISAFYMNANTHRTKGFAGLSVRRPLVTQAATSEQSTAASATADDDAHNRTTISISITDKQETFKLFMQVPHHKHLYYPNLNCRFCSE
jgi:hypothetical protein